MAAKQIKISTRNPNRDYGRAGGCACSPSEQRDCRGPYAIFYANQMADPGAPHVVVCMDCIDHAKKLLEQGKVLAIGNTPDPEPKRKRKSEPEADFEDLDI